MSKPRWKCVRLCNKNAYEVADQFQRLEEKGWDVRFVTDDGACTTLYATYDPLPGLQVPAGKGEE